jgi:hypothetical protein
MASTPPRHSAVRVAGSKQGATYDGVLELHLDGDLKKWGLQIQTGWTLQPDFQYIVQPGGNLPNASRTCAVGEEDLLVLPLSSPFSAGRPSPGERPTAALIWVGWRGRAHITRFNAKRLHHTCRELLLKAISRSRSKRTFA